MLAKNVSKNIPTNEQYITSTVSLFGNFIGTTMSAGMSVLSLQWISVSSKSNTIVFLPVFSKSYKKYCEILIKIVWFKSKANCKNVWTLILWMHLKWNTLLLKHIKRYWFQCFAELQRMKWLNKMFFEQSFKILSSGNLKMLVF